MFEYQTPDLHRVHCEGSTPVEFIFGGKHFRIHSVLSRWSEAGGWWNRIDDGLYRPDDRPRALWRVEAAPLGTVLIFELERDQASQNWRITSI